MNVTTTAMNPDAPARHAAVAPPLPACFASMQVLDVHVPLATGRGGIAIVSIPHVTWFGPRARVELVTWSCPEAGLNVAAGAGASVRLLESPDSPRRVSVDVTRLRAVRLPGRATALPAAAVLGAILEATRRNLAAIGPAVLELPGLREREDLHGHAWPVVLAP